MVAICLQLLFVNVEISPYLWLPADEKRGQRVMI